MSNLPQEADPIRKRFLALTGLSSVDVEPEAAGPEAFLRFCVGRSAPLYRTALARIDEELPPEHPFHGRLSLKVGDKRPLLPSTESELLQSLVSRSLQVTHEAAERGFSIDFVPFRGREEILAAQPAHHAILGRRGVGKSTLILLTYRRVESDENLPVWIDAQPYRGRTDGRVVLELLAEIFREILRVLGDFASGPGVAELRGAADEIAHRLSAPGGAHELEHARQLAPSLHHAIRAFTRGMRKQVFLFLDDAHLVDPVLQPFVFDLVYSVVKAAGGWLNISGVNSLLRLYEPSSKLGLQHPSDVQLIPLDLTLVDPAAAREHLTSVLRQFLAACGIGKSGEMLGNAAIDRLVWCSAGVPRDFLWLFSRSMSFALQHRRPKIGVQEVNLAVGEFGQQKMHDLQEDTSAEGQSLQLALERLQNAVLTEHRSTSFLVPQQTKHEGYRTLQKLVDLRLVHLIHPSITPQRAGERYEAYLLDYSFYTGIRRRHGLRELKIAPNQAPRYGELRRLPKIDLDEISGMHA